MARCRIPVVDASDRALRLRHYLHDPSWLVRRRVIASRGFAALLNLEMSSMAAERSAPIAVTWRISAGRRQPARRAIVSQTLRHHVMYH